MFPPGKTCADAKEVDVSTRWRRRTSLVGERSMMLELGRGAIGCGFLLLAAPDEPERRCCP